MTLPLIIYLTAIDQLAALGDHVYNYIHVYLSRQLITGSTFEAMQFMKAFILSAASIVYILIVPPTDKIFQLYE